MVNSSKILTVSYGTFSCTLEGFDDSFDTMKAIAEYFRDLAADDRYFGAEPPTPDADMLARIAEREIARRVEAHEERGKIVLRASEASALAAALDVADAPAEAPAEEAAPLADTPEEASEEPAVAKATEVEPQAKPEEAPAEIEEPLAEVEETTAEESDVEAPVEAEAPVEEVEEPAQVVSEHSSEPDTQQEVAAEEEAPEAQLEEIEPLSVTADRIELEVDEPETEAFDQVTPEESVAESAPAPEAAAADEPEASGEEPITAEGPQQVETQEIEEPTVADAAEEIEAAVDAAFGADEFVPQMPSAMDDAEGHADPDSVAAKLSRIRSVVLNNDESYAETDYSEDEHAESDEAQDFLSDVAADLGAVLAQDDAAEVQDQKADAPTADEVLSSLAEHVAEGSVADEQPELLEDEDADNVLQDTLAQLMADAIPSQDLTEDQPDASEGIAGDDNIRYDEPIVLRNEGEDQPPLNARVIKMKRSEFEAAIANGLLEEGTESGETDENVFDVDEMAEAATDDDQAGENLLSPEDEEELRRELAEVEADFQPAADLEELSEPEVEPETEHETSAEDHEDEPEAAAEGEPTYREGKRQFEGSADDSSEFERIFDETDTQLDAPESSQRRSAIQHLRAAVAATRAEKKAGAELQKDVDDAPYRSDLANVVRPRRPSAKGDTSRSERPASDGRAAPLKLVAEQRIDTERAPIRPRRVSAADPLQGENPGTDSDSNFTDFAAQMGATQLPDLLEAAAAYMSDVEGRPQFSRPMLMHKLQEVEKEKFSREDGLRSFGQLLRQGKLQKLKGGRFAVTDETEFRAETRHAG